MLSLSSGEVGCQHFILSSSIPLHRAEYDDLRYERIRIGNERMIYFAAFAARVFVRESNCGGSLIFLSPLNSLLLLNQLLGTGWRKGAGAFFVMMGGLEGSLKLFCCWYRARLID